VSPAVNPTLHPEHGGPLPAALPGVWRRTLLDGPGMEPDTETTVLWLQTRRWHADLRLPPHRPDFSACTGLDDCTPEQLRWLAGQQGFAGITTVDPGAPPQRPMLCQWHRQIDFQPPRGRRDIGSIVLSDDGATLEERGIDAEYREIWQRLASSQGPSAGWRRSGPGPAALLLVAGACFLYARDRPEPLPTGAGAQAATLAELLRQFPREGARMLDLELSFGHWRDADGVGTITHSSLPWREGAAVQAGPGWEALDDA